MSAATSPRRCGCGVPVFKGDEGVCDSCAREQRIELREAAKPIAEILAVIKDSGLNIQADTLRVKRAHIETLGAAIAKAEGGAS